MEGGERVNIHGARCNMTTWDELLFRGKNGFYGRRGSRYGRTHGILVLPYLIGRLRDGSWLDGHRD